MSKFFKTSNKAGLIGGGLVLAGVILIILWMTVLSEANGVSNFVSRASIVVGALLFGAGFGYISAKSGRKG